MSSTPSASPACAESVKPPYRGAFDIVYVENEAASHPRTREILSRLPNATVIPCGNYKEIFNRPRQEPALQKRAQALILAVAKPPYLYPGAPVCQSFGSPYFYYTNGVMNCVYDCEYCYLQGMYPSGHMVAFVNLEDTWAELDRLLSEHEAYVCISYDTDLLALEPLLGFCGAWMRYAADRPDLTVELRTKCASRSTLRSLPHSPGTILALTLSPDEVIRAHEHRTPSLSMRLSMALEAISLGIPLRLCFDPVIAVPDAEAVYGRMFDEVFATVPMASVRDVSLGLFRISKEYLKAMRRHRPCGVTLYPYELTGGVYHYPADTADRLMTFAKERLLAVIPEDKLFLWESDSFSDT